MKTKLIKLSDIVADTKAQQRESINFSVVEEYAESIRCGAKFPPVTVFSDSVNFYLADGFHRYEAFKLLEINDIEAEIHDGGLDEAELHSYGSNKGHGLRRSQADKKKAVIGMLIHPKWGKWTNRDIASHVGVSHTYVNKLRDFLETSDESSSGNVSTSQVNILKNKESEKKLSTGNEENHEEFDEKEQVIIELKDTVISLDEENTRLKDALAANQLPEDEIQSATEIIAELRSKIKVLEAELDAVKSSRDAYLVENSELKKQCAGQRNQLKKFGSDK